jgi:hypothetical protein
MVTGSAQPPRRNQLKGLEMRREKLHYIGKIQSEIRAHSRHSGRIHRLAEFELREQLAEFIVGPHRELVRTGDVPEKGVIGTAFTYWRTRPLARDSRLIA